MHTPNVCGVPFFLFLLQHRTWSEQHFSLLQTLRGDSIGVTQQRLSFFTSISVLDASTDLLISQEEQACFSE